jgi:hypothetical protein
VNPFEVPVPTYLAEAAAGTDWYRTLCDVMEKIYAGCSPSS